MQSLSWNVMEIRALCEAGHLRLVHDGNCFIRNADDNNYKCIHSTLPTHVF